MLLRSCGGYEPYLRLSQGVVEPGRVLDFFLRDRLFPRSAYASLTLAEECLDKINSGRHGTWEDARGLVGLARAELEYSAPATLSRGLGDPARAPAGLHLLGERRRDPALLRPGPARCSGGREAGADDPNGRLAAPCLARDPLRLQRPGAGLLQRAAPHAAHRARQTALETKVVTMPPAPQYSYVDYWGTRWWPSTSTGAMSALHHRERRSSTRRTPANPRTHVGGRVRRLAHHGRPPLTQALHRSRTGAVRNGPGPAHRRPLETARRIMERTHQSLRYVRG
jgi:hypothetical protein